MLWHLPLADVLNLRMLIVQDTHTDGNESHAKSTVQL